MAKRADLAARQPTLERALGATEWPHPPAAPGWMAWTPQAAVLWALAHLATVPRGLVVVSLAFPVYYVGLSLALQARAHTARRP